MGLPYTTKDGVPFVIVAAPVLADRVNTVVVLLGVVEKVNDDPPFTAVNAEMALVPATLKSDTNPVVMPIDPATTTVHKTASPERDGFVLRQLKDEAVVGLP